MTKFQWEIDQAFKLISAIAVSGDAVDVMSAARNHLRTAYGMADEQTEEHEDG